MIGNFRLGRGPVAASVMVAAAVLLAGCSQSSVASTDEDLSSAQIVATAKHYQDAGNQWLAERLSDGVVDESDYQLAFDRLNTCMEGKGYAAADPILNPATNLSFLYRFDPAGRAQEAFDSDEDACRDPDFGVVESIYVSTNEQFMDEPLRAAVQKCLASAGIEVPNSARSFESMVGNPSTDGGKQRTAVMKCVATEAKSLYPDLPYIALGY